MLIGVPKEIKNHAYRVGLTPSSVREPVAGVHQVVVERDAGAGMGAADADEAFARAELIGKVTCREVANELYCTCHAPQSFPVA